MPFLSRLAIVSLLVAPAALAEDIDWSADLPAGFAEAKTQQKILMICVNAKHVAGEKVEPAAKGLREVVYKDARVVEKSREFVCVLFKRTSQAKEFGELRLLGIEGDIVSPQHIFVHPDGDRILLRKQYWSHGQGEPAVKALLAMMDQAHANLAAPAPPEPKKPVVADAPDGDQRPAWIDERLREVREGDRPECLAAIGALIRNDREGDCTTPLVAILADKKLSTERIVVLVRGMGRNRFFAGALPIAGLLNHKKPEVRGNAAVSLEYIGSRDKKVVAALKRAAGAEKDEAIANHVCRALGRCGVEDAPARSLLLKKCGSGKSEFVSYGPAIGLAYFEGDAKAMRGVEKILKKIGIPGGRRGAGQNTIKRSVVSWTLGWIGDKKSGAFVRKELVAKLENTQAFWVAPLRSFYKRVARKCEGREENMAGIEGGVRGVVGFVKGMGTEIRPLMDEYRNDREEGDFTPRGDNLFGDGGGP